MMESALRPLAEHLTCEHCQLALRERIKNLVVQWSVVKVSVLRIDVAVLTETEDNIIITSSVITVTLHTRPLGLHWIPLVVVFAISLYYSVNTGLFCVIMTSLRTSIGRFWGSITIIAFRLRQESRR